jgi:hypothetical protein
MLVAVTMFFGLTDSIAASRRVAREHLRQEGEDECWETCLSLTHLSPV